MVERGDWAGAAALEVRPNRFPHVMAITHFARALGAARTGKPDAAKADIAKLAELRDGLREAKDAYWSEQVDIQWQVASAWVLYAEGKHDEALEAMAAAADGRGQDREVAGDARTVRRRRASSWARCCSSAAWPRRRSPHSRRR